MKRLLVVLLITCAAGLLTIDILREQKFGAGDVTGCSQRNGRQPGDG
jgi:hypothetical protein